MDWETIVERAATAPLEQLTEFERALPLPDRARRVTLVADQRDPWAEHSADDRPWLGLARCLRAEATQVARMDDHSWVRWGLPAITRLELPCATEPRALRWAMARLPALTTLALPTSVYPGTHPQHDLLGSLRPVPGLELAFTGLAFVDLLRSEAASGLLHLDLSGCWCHERDFIETLGRLPLRSLVLARNEIGESDLRALARTPLGSSLTHLDVRGMARRNFGHAWTKRFVELRSLVVDRNFGETSTRLRKRAYITEASPNEMLEPPAYLRAMLVESASQNFSLPWEHAPKQVWSVPPVAVDERWRAPGESEWRGEDTLVIGAEALTRAAASGSGSQLLPGVRALILSSALLVEGVRSAFMALPALETVDLSECASPGLQPILCELPAIRRLILHRRVVGERELDALLASKASLTLRELDLSWSRVLPAAWPRLQRLPIRSLILRGCMLRDQDFAFLNRSLPLASLNELDLRDNLVRDWPALARSFPAGLRVLANQDHPASTKISMWSARELDELHVWADQMQDAGEPLGERLTLSMAGQGNENPCEIARLEQTKPPRPSQGHYEVLDLVAARFPAEVRMCWWHDLMIGLQIVGGRPVLHEHALDLARRLLSLPEARFLRVLRVDVRVKGEAPLSAQIPALLREPGVVARPQMLLLDTKLVRLAHRQLAIPPPPELELDVGLETGLRSVYYAGRRILLPWASGDMKARKRAFKPFSTRILAAEEQLDARDLTRLARALWDRSELVRGWAVALLPAIGIEAAPMIPELTVLGYGRHGLRVLAALKQLALDPRVVGAVADGFTLDQAAVTPWLSKANSAARRAIPRIERMLANKGLERSIREPLLRARAEFSRCSIGPQEIELNAASIEMLQRVPGIGPVLSQRIIAYRQERSFEQVIDLLQIPGFTAPQVNMMRRYLSVANNS